MRYAAILSGGLVAYGAFFVYPIFLMTPAMNNLMVVPAHDWLGIDLSYMIAYARELVAGRTPYIEPNLYPPLATVLFVPILFAQYPYAVMVVVTITAYAVAAAVAVSVAQERGIAVAFLLMAAVSYPMQFELERGQFNLLAAALALGAVWLYHHKPGVWVAAYAMLSAAIQLKLYPLIFIVLMVRDWRDWRGNLMRFGVLAIVNVGLLFVLGGDVFTDFMQSVVTKGGYSTQWVGDHSISSFVGIAVRILPVFAPYADAITIAGMGLAAGLVAVNVAARRGEGIDPYVLAAAAIGAALISPLSNDYKLVVVFAPMAALLATRMHPLTLFVLATMFCVTLLPYTGKPTLLRSNTPALMVMLVVLTVQHVWYAWRQHEQH